MKDVWKIQQKHIPCIQDVSDVPLYTKVGRMEKGCKNDLSNLKAAKQSSRNRWERNHLRSN